MCKKGDIWQLGKHYLLCGDCTDEEDVTRLFNGAKPELLITDPPYCSGGVQEAGVSLGSKGTTSGYDKHPMLNDMRSTRGFQKLLSSMLSLSPTLWNYIFTDWRIVWEM